jgi:hypothetical protein
VSALARHARSIKQGRSVDGGAGALIALAVRVAVLALAAGLIVMLVATPAAAASPALSGLAAGARSTCGPELARAFTAALNAHDVEALVDLFGDAGAGPTVQADRYAWNKHEIRLWAQQQTRANIRVHADDYGATENGATWSAVVHRDDWHAAGVEALAVTNRIWVEDGKLVAFAASPTDWRDAARLGHFWRPGVGPEWSTDWEVGA